MKMRSIAKLGAVAALATVSLAACGTSSNNQKAKDQTIHVMETSALASMDNAKATDIISGETLNNTGEGLLRFGKNSKTLPGLAKSYHKSKDGLTYTFNLRKSQWSNGEKLTAQDFVYSWRRTITPKTGSQYAYLYADIKNANAVMTGKKAPSALGVKKDGDYKLVVTLAHPVSYFPTLVAQQCFYPVNKGAVEKYGSKFASNAQKNVYNGPFKLTSWSGTSDNWTLTKNKKYWNAKVVKLQHVKYSAVKDPQTALSQYQSGKLDVISLSGQQPKNYKNDKEFHSRKSSRINYVELNQRKDTMLQNTKARLHQGPSSLIPGAEPATIREQGAPRWLNACHGNRVDRVSHSKRQGLRQGSNSAISHDLQFSQGPEVMEPGVEGNWPDELFLNLIGRRYASW